MTTETDKAERMAFANEYMVPTEVARRLERERDEAREALREIEAADWKTSGELRGMARKALEAAK